MHPLLILSPFTLLTDCLQARQHIATILSQFEGEGDHHIAGPYIPKFYQDCRAILDCHQAEVCETNTKLKCCVDYVFIFIVCSFSS